MALGNGRLITIIGGSGFIGRHLVQKLASQGYRIRVGVRRPDLAVHLQPLGNVGQIMPVQANVRFPASLESACQGADVVINLSGILNSSGTQTFEAVHEFGAEAVAKAAKSCGARKLIHLSAICADKDASSQYCQSKAKGEELVKKAFPNVSIVRPSLVFGQEDSFFNKFAELTRFSMVLPLIGKGDTKFQPVFVGDVADGISAIVNAPKNTSRIFEFGGPEVFTFKEMLQFILHVTKRKRLLFPIPVFAAKIMGSILGFLPYSLLTRDQVQMLQSNHTISKNAAKQKRTLEGLGIQPDTLAAQVPSYLYRYRKFGQFTETGNSSI